MPDVINWLLLNKEWLFYGAGLLAITVIAKIFCRSKNDGIKSNKQTSCMFSIGSINNTTTTQNYE
ncbi:hypothetical protein ACK4QZ_18525, partial [Proteus mirabilis]|uniref:hypothetical protein n=1 Tax=Proteus mirabilis TaxID=584 RepID=UPI003919DED0